jgi:hypothetical protein
MEIFIFEAEDIARQMKRANLAATIRQSAFNHLKDIVSGLTLSENLGMGVTQYCSGGDG